MNPCTCDCHRQHPYRTSAPVPARREAQRPPPMPTPGPGQPLYPDAESWDRRDRVLFTALGLLAMAVVALVVMVSP